MRVRWALEEVGQDYDARLLAQGEQKMPAHLARQPFGQVPTYEDDDVALFESGAIVFYIAERFGGLLPADRHAKAHAIQWMFAALNSVEPEIMELLRLKYFEADKPWAQHRRPAVDERVHERLTHLSRQLGDRRWLHGDTFTAGDLLMVTVLRFILGDGSVERYENLLAYVRRGMARPAFLKALSSHMASFTADPPDWYPAPPTK